MNTNSRHMKIAADKDRGYATGSYASKATNRGLTSRPFHKALGGVSTRKPTLSWVQFTLSDGSFKEGYVVAVDVLTKQLMVAVGRIAKSYWTVPIASVREVVYSPRAEGEQFFDLVPWEGRKVQASDWE